MSKRGNILQVLFYLLIVIVCSSISSADSTVPTADAYANATSGRVPLPVQFMGTGTGGNGTLTYSWDLNGDGSFETSGQNPTYTYTTGGTYTVTLNVTDEDGDSSTDSIMITAQQYSPSITLSKTLVTTTNLLDGVISFRITITNNGDATLNTIALTDSYDNDELDFQNANVSGYTESSSQVQWSNLGTLEAGKSLSILVNFTGEETGSTSNYASVSAKDPSLTTVTSSASASVNILASDTQAPSVILDYPADEFYTNAKQITFKWNVTDNIDEEMLCDLLIDDEIVEDDIEVQNNSRESETADVDKGNHTWRVSCRDDNDNVGNSSARKFYVNMTRAYLVAYEYNLDIGSVSEYLNQSSLISLKIDGMWYNLTLVEVYAASVRINVAALDDDYFIQDGKALSLDLDDDDAFDLKMTLVSLSAGRHARLRFEKYVEPVNITPIVNVTMNETEENATVNETIEEQDEPEENATVAAAQTQASLDMQLVEDLIKARQALQKAQDSRGILGSAISTVEKYPWYFLGCLLLVIVLLYGAFAVFRRPRLLMTGPPLPNQLRIYVENAIKDGVYKGEIHSSLIKAGWSEPEINRALLFSRMKADLKNKMAPDFIRADLVAQGWSNDEIREAFTYFNVKLNLEKNIPLEKIQAALVEKGVPHNEINRAVLYNKVMGADKEVTEGEIKDALRKRGWSKDQIKRALFYAYVKKKINEGVVIGKIEEELLKEGKDRGEIKQMIKGLRKQL